VVRSGLVVLLWSPLSPPLWILHVCLAKGTPNTEWDLFQNVFFVFFFFGGVGVFLLYVVNSSEMFFTPLCLPSSHCPVKKEIPPRGVFFFFFFFFFFL